MPMNVADNNVKIYAWMNATNNSIQNIKVVNSTEITIIDAFPATPNPTVKNITEISPITIACPPIMLAKRRIIKAKGLVN